MREHPQPEEIEIAYVHPRVDLSDLKENNKILSVDQINLIKGFLKDKKDGRYEKKDLKGIKGLEDLPFGVVKFSDESGEEHYHAIYSGKRKGKLLGEGSFGYVKLTQDLDTGDFGVIKIMGLPQGMENVSDDTKNEIKNLLNTYRRNEEQALDAAQQLIVKFYEREKKPDQTEVLITLIKGIDLDHFIRANKEMPTIRSLDMAIGMTEAVAAVHEARILHRDIKPGNMVYDAATGKTTLIDFGFAVAFGQRPLTMKDRRVGSPNYMAPEINKKYGSVTYNESTDGYALALSIAKALGLTETIKGQLYLATEKSGAFKNNKQIQNSTERKKILRYLKKMTNKNPAARPNLTDFLKFLTDLREEHLQTLRMQRRIGYLTIEDYQKAMAGGDDDKNKMLTALRGMDEVCLVDKNGASQDRYVHLKRELETAGVVVNNKVVQHDNGDLDTLLLRRAENLSKEKHLVYECHHIEHTLPKIIYKTAVGGARIIPDNQKEMVLFSLEGDLTRFTNKIDLQYPYGKETFKNQKHKLEYEKQRKIYETQTGLISNAMSEIQKPGLTYDGLRSKLSQLEKNLLLVNIIPEEQRSIKDKMKIFLEEHISFFSTPHRKTVLDEIKNLDKKTTEEKPRKLGK